MKLNSFTSLHHDKPLALHRTALDAILRADALDKNALYIQGRDDGRYAFDFQAGVAIIPVRDVLTKDGWWGCSYEWMRNGLDAALDAPEVGAIVLLVDSPGGTVEGCFDFADYVFSCRGKKPILAILDECAFSAAYAIASAADHITIPRTGAAGSIGVVTCHVDISEALSAAGVKVTYIQFGAKKTDGAAEKPLTDENIACIQAEIDEMGELFVNTVARNRGLSVDIVKGTEAATYLGQAAVDIGLCDEVASPDDAFLALLKKLG